MAEERLERAREAGREERGGLEEEEEGRREEPEAPILQRSYYGQS